MGGEKMPDKKKQETPLDWLPSRKIRKNADASSMITGFNLVINFGIVLAVSLWITLKVGGYLDQKLHTGYLFTFIGVGMGIFSSFRVLFDQIKKWDETYQGDEEDE